MSRTTTQILLLLLGSLLSLTALAETSENRASLSNNPRTQAYLNDKSVESNLLEIGKQWDEDLGIPCTEVARAKYSASNVGIIQPIEFPEGVPHPVAGRWLVRFQLIRCGVGSVLNALAVAQKDSPPKYSPLLPGATIASPELQNDALAIAKLKLALESKVNQNKECSDFAIANTFVGNIPVMKGGAISGRWEEKWIARYCGKFAVVPLCFTPNARGTSILAVPCAEAPQ